MLKHIPETLRTQFENQILYLLFKKINKKKKKETFSLGDNILLNPVENEAGTQKSLKDGWKITDVSLLL